MQLSDVRLSEAIRLGGTLKPQGFGNLYYEGKTCAWGAAFDAVGELQNVMSAYDSIGPFALFHALEEAHKHWTWCLTKVASCPECGRSLTVEYVISICLGDKHHWTRERTADWVESIERGLGLWPAEAAQPEPAPESVDSTPTPTSALEPVTVAL